MIAQELEVSLHMAFVEARQQRHEFITVEHLLMALLDNPSAAEVLRACSANLDDLRKSLLGFIKENTPTVGGADEVDTQPTLGFQRVIQRAIMHVQSTGSGKKEVTGANVLVAIFGEKDSHAVYYLHQQGVTRPRRRQLHRPRHQEDRPAGVGQAGRELGLQHREREGRGRRQGLAARPVHAEPEPARQGRQDRSADRPRARGRAGDPDPVPPAQEQPAAGRRGRRRQDRDRRGPGLAHHPERRARDPGRVGRLLARHGRAARRHQVPRRLRAAPEGRAQAPEGPAERDPLHRRDPHPDRRRRRLGRHARRQQPAQARAQQRGDEVHRRDHLHRVPRHLREGRGAVAALPEGRRGRAFDRADGRDPEGPEVALRGAPQRQVRAGGAAGRGRALGQVHQRPAPARQGDRRDRRGRRGAAHPAEEQAEEDDQPQRGRGDRRQDRAHPAGQRLERRPRQAEDASTAT